MIRAEADPASASEPSTAATAPATTMDRERGSIPALNTTDRPGLLCSELQLQHVDGLGALVALLLFVGDLGAFDERAVAVARDAREVDEQVAAALVGRDEAESLVVAEPLDRAGAHW